MNINTDIFNLIMNSHPHFSISIKLHTHPNTKSIRKHQKTPKKHYHIHNRESKNHPQLNNNPTTEQHVNFLTQLHEHVYL